MRKYFAIFTILALIITLSACKKDDKDVTTTTQTTTTEQQAPQTSELIIDGVLDDEEYTLPSFFTGAYNKTEIKYHIGENGIYLGADVFDEKLFMGAENAEESLADYMLRSDDIEFFLDLKFDKGPIAKADDFQVRVNPEGEYVVLRGGAAGAIDASEAWEVAEIDIDEIEVVTDGTISIAQMGANPDQTTVTDVDNGYVVEMFISYQTLGLTNKPTQVGFAVFHRDIYDEFSAKTETAAPNVIVPDTYYVWDNNGIGVPNVTADVEVDGDLTDEAWTGANVVTFDYPDAPLPINVKAFLGTNGLHVGIDVEDQLLNARHAGSIWMNDNFEIRIDADNNGEINGSDRLFLIDLNGMRWLDKWAGRVAYGAEFLLGRTINGSLNDNADVDTGWTTELFIPYSELGITNPASGTTVSVMVAIMESDGTDNTPYLNDTASWDLPETYTDVTKQ